MTGLYLYIVICSQVAVHLL